MKCSALQFYVTAVYGEITQIIDILMENHERNEMRVFQSVAAALLQRYDFFQLDKRLLMALSSTSKHFIYLQLVHTGLEISPANTPDSPV